MTTMNQPQSDVPPPTPMGAPGHAQPMPAPSQPLITPQLVPNPQHMAPGGVQPQAMPPQAMPMGAVPAPIAQPGMPQIAPTTQNMPSQTPIMTPPASAGAGVAPQGMVPTAPEPALGGMDAGSLGQIPMPVDVSPAIGGAIPEDMAREGGEKALPQISITAFCERNETAATINEITRDWRMKRTNVNIFMGGLPAAIEVYHKENTPNLILIESGMRGAELFDQLESLASVCDAGTKVVIIGAANDIRLYRQLIDKGVSDYLVPPFHPLTLIRTLSDLYVDPDKPFVGRTAAFFGAKGGVGSSTLAHNIAWCMSEVIGQETALIDMDASWGTTGLDFAYDAAQGLEEALADPERLDETLLDRIMLRHTAKLSILPSASSLLTVPTTSIEAHEKLIDSVRGLSPMNILDVPHIWNDWTTAILNGADDVVITATPDLANLRNTKNLLDYLKSQRPNDLAPILILNKMGMAKTNEIKVKDFATAVGMEPALVIGFDPESYMEAVNDGKMLTDVKAAAQTVAGLNYMAERLKTGEYPAIPRVRSGSKGLSLGSRKLPGVNPDIGAKKSKSLLSRFKKK